VRQDWRRGVEPVSNSLRFHSLVWFWWRPNRLDISLGVFRPLAASKASSSLNSAPKRVQLFDMTESARACELWASFLTLAHSPVFEADHIERSVESARRSAPSIRSPERIRCSRTPLGNPAIDITTPS